MLYAETQRAPFHFNERCLLISVRDRIRGTRTAGGPDGIIGTNVGSRSSKISLPIFGLKGSCIDPLSDQRSVIRRFISVFSVRGLFFLRVLRVLRGYIFSPWSSV